MSEANGGLIDNIKIYNEFCNDKFYFIQTLVFYIKNNLYLEFGKLNNYNKLFDLGYKVNILTERDKDINSRGCYFAVESENNIYINVYEIINYIKNAENNKNYSDEYLIKQIFITFLHEFKHCLLNIEDYLNDNKKTLEEVFDIKNDSIAAYQNKRKTEDVNISVVELSREIDEELICDYYSYDKINTILEIYEAVSRGNILV